MLRGSAVAIVVVTFIAAGVVGASTFGGWNSDAKNDSAAPILDSNRVAAVPAPHVDSTTFASSPQPVTPPATAPLETPKPTTPATSHAPFAPAIARGETILTDSVVAVRSDSDVVVRFDRPMLRTRRPEKFEQFVRTTLAAVYGAPAGDALSKLPIGAIAGQGDLLNELPTRGVRIPVNDAWIIRLFPEIRVGHDGPLVIRYRVRLVPAGG